jgi:hypothetical protein
LSWRLVCDSIHRSCVTRICLGYRPGSLRRIFTGSYSLPPLVAIRSFRVKKGMAFGRNSGSETTSSGATRRGGTHQRSTAARARGTTARSRQGRRDRGLCGLDRAKAPYGGTGLRARASELKVKFPTEHDGTAGKDRSGEDRSVAPAFRARCGVCVLAMNPCPEKAKL